MSAEAACVHARLSVFVITRRVMGALLLPAVAEHMRVSQLTNLIEQLADVEDLLPWLHTLRRDLEGLIIRGAR